jgi:hypothetical protein
MREEDLIVCSVLLLYNGDKTGDEKVELYSAPLTAAMRYSYGRLCMSGTILAPAMVKHVISYSL